MDPGNIAALIGAGLALAGAIAGLLGFVIKVSITAGKILKGVEDQGAALAEHGAELKQHREILTNGLRAGVRENTKSIRNIEPGLGEIRERLRALPCTPPVLRCRPAAPQQSREGETR